MNRKHIRRFALLLLTVGLLALASTFKLTSTQTARAADSSEGGALQILDKTGRVSGVCPLKHTRVETEISGFLARVRVTQEFTNPTDEAIEAVYTFPLSADAAVDDMTMRVGERTVRGRILRREEAQAVYDAARDAGQVAGLLDQERPNIFTQRVVNITSGAEIKIEISYVETLKYEAGTYEWSFPVTVGPRYIPGGQARDAGAPGGLNANAPARVPDAARIKPPTMREGVRAGHDISLSVKLDAGVPVDEIKSPSHDVAIEREDDARALVKLKDAATIPNKDFVLRFDAASKRIEDALLAHRKPDSQGGYFTFIMQPPDRVAAQDVTPKELVFVLDTSGSMRGFPVEKAKEAMKLALDGLHPQDTFNLITFSGDTRILFPAPVPASGENLRRAQTFLGAAQGAGGTEMMKAIEAALKPTASQDHIRIVCFMTDGYVGNDFEIISQIQKYKNARVFSFGIGNSVNRFLLDKMAEAGRGAVEYVSLTDDGSAAARRFHERVRTPLLTDIEIEWNGLPVADIYPQRIPDLFSQTPLVVTGRYTAPMRGTLKVRGRTAGGEFTREIPVDLPANEPRHDVLASLWARRRIDALMSEDYLGMQRGTTRPDLKETITNIGLEYRLLTQFTSFVAVEEVIVTDGTKPPRRIEVPIELPSGVSNSALDGANEMVTVSASKAMLMATARSVTNAPAKRQVGRGAARGGGTQPPPMATPIPAPGLSANMNANASVFAGRPEADERADMILARRLVKLHPKISAVIGSVEGRKALPADASFVREGRAEIQLTLDSKTAEELKQLEKLGFEIIFSAPNSKIVIGRAPVELLAAIAELRFVRYVAPLLKG